MYGGLCDVTLDVLSLKGWVGIRVGLYRVRVRLRLRLGSGRASEENCKTMHVWKYIKSFLYFV
jgi:hypothetical protein